MRRKRRAVVAILGCVIALAWSSSGLTAQGRMARIGILEPGHPSARAHLIDAFRQALRELGYEERRTIALELRFAEGDLKRLPDMATDLVRLKVDAIVVATTPGIRAAQRATQTIPIVMTAVGDPVEAGFVASLAKPGGNITGRTIQAPELSAKRLQLLKETVPKVSRVAILWDSANSHEVHGYKEAETAAPGLGVTLLSIEVKRPDDFEAAFATMVREGANGLLVFENATNTNYRKRIAELAARHRLPALYGLREYAQAGGLISYGPALVDNYRRAAAFVDKILKGVKPADLPVEQPTRFELLVNLATARGLGLTLPPAILIRADQVIEEPR